MKACSSMRASSSFIFRFDSPVKPDSWAYFSFRNALAVAVAAATVLMLAKVLVLSPSLANRLSHLHSVLTSTLLSLWPCTLLSVVARCFFAALIGCICCYVSFSRLEGLNQNPELPTLTRPNPPDTELHVSRPQSSLTSHNMYIYIYVRIGVRIPPQSISPFVNFIVICGSDFDDELCDMVNTDIESTFDDHCPISAACYSEHSC